VDDRVATALCVLGPLEVVREREPVRLGSGQQRRLLAALLVHANEVVSSDRLVDVLWGDDPPVSATHALQTLVSRLRGTLGGDRLETRAPGYRLRVASGEVDALQFEELVRVGLGAADQPGVALRAFDEALGLWRGPPYAEFANEEFAAAEAARLVELRARAIEERSAALLELGRPGEVIGELEAEIAAEPFRERQRALLMLALARAGRPVESLRAYEAFRRFLADEVGVVPSTGLQELNDDIVRQHPDVSWAGSPTKDDLPAGTVTFLFTDVEGSTRLWAEHPDGMHVALARHDEIVRSVIESHGGHVVKMTGDGFHAAFSTAHNAVDAAIDAQRCLGAESWGATGPLRVRMGVHTGEVQHRDRDYYGTAVNRAARLMAVGHGGQLLVSDATERLLRDSAGESFALVDLGEHRLPDLAQASRVFQVVAPGLQGEFPPLRSLDLLPGNLPLQVSSFVGRERELARVAEALGNARVVTLTGVGGVGKTRLALQVAAEVLPGYREGAWLVELAPVRDPDGVVDAFAAVFGVSARAGQSLEESLVEFLRTKQLLLVVDNCEHLREAVAVLVETLERSCAGVVVLATSREGLSLAGEQNLTVPSLAVAAVDTDLEAIAQSEAVELFVARAQLADADFALTPENAAAVVQVCGRLDGVPLAIELAAAQVITMNPAELARGLDRRFDTLAGGRRRAVQRHQTLRAAIDWSYELCSEPERRLLARMSVFAGGATRDAVEGVCAGDPIDGRQVFSLLGGLVAQSLVIAQRDGPDTRYRLLETIREYGEERLAEHGETETLRSRHAAYYRDFARVVNGELRGPHQVEAGRRFAAEHENLLSAMSFAVDRGDVDVALELLTASAPAAQVGYQLRLPTDVLGLDGAPERPLYPLGLGIAAVRAAQRGDRMDAERLCNEAVAAARRLGSDPDRLSDEWVANARQSLAFAAGAFPDAARFAEQEAEIGRATGRVYAVANGLAAAATWHTMASDPDTALPLATEGLAVARSLGAPYYIGLNLAALAGALADRDPDRAAALLHEDIQRWDSLDYENGAEIINAALISARIRDWPTALELAPRAIRHLHWLGDRPQLAGILNILARVLAPHDPESAAILQGAARRIATAEVAEPVTPSPAPIASGASTETPAAHTSRNAGFVTELRRETTGLLATALGDERVRALRAQGETMDTDEVAAYALNAAARSDPLTAPES
jgi:predicted ATPase/class 3 adenylate cyclase